MNRPTINYNKVKQEAGDCKISAFLLMKRKLNYRKVDNNYPWKNCGKCKLRRELKFTSDDKNRLQCEVIGYNKDISADVDENNLCDNFK